VEGALTNLESALGYAEKGLLVFPCGVDKKPLTENGYKNASKDPEQIRAWWAASPDASIGLPTGSKNGLWVLDIDMPDGPKSLSEIEKNNERLPKTLTQRTGGGGTQYFWKWNGHDIRNRTKIALNIDVRGEGGYVIVPPSSHPSGKQYAWTQKAPIIEAPAWLADLVSGESPQKPLASNKSTYGEKALAGEIIKLSQVTEGERNTTLNNAAYSLGQLIAGGELDQATVEGALFGLALSKGLPQKEAQATIRSGIESGKLHPRSNPYKDEYYLEIEDQSNQSNQSNQNVSKSSEVIKVITGNQEVIKGGVIGNQSNQNGNQSNQESSPETGSGPYNLASHIREWIVNSTGSFTVDQLDREFCLITRKDKMNRAKILSIYSNKKNNLIRKDKSIKGKWHVLESNVEWVDLETANDDPFPVDLPFELSERCFIPRRGIIVLAGSTNAGKTTFLLSVLKSNIEKEYTKVYLMSEMGKGLYKRRIQKFGIPIAKWQESIKASEQSYGFDGTIQSHNPDGLTCIDFLEEIDGEYYKIPSSIRDIYDALGEGLVIIAIQKSVNSQFAKGGEGTKEKPCLYMLLDFLCEGDRCIYCALKLTKVKESLQDEMQGQELHFKIERGSDMTVVMDWTPAHKVDRAKCAIEYQAGIVNTDSEIWFKTDKDRTVRVLAKDIKEWQEAFKFINVIKELEKISQESVTRKPLKDKWFMQVSGLLNIINERKRR